MRRLVPVLVVLVAAALAVGRYAAAQDASPAASPVFSQATGEQGASFEPIAGGVAEVLPPAPVTIQIIRVRLAPGGGFGEPDGDPGTGVIVVENGALTLNVTRPVVVTRAATAATPGASAREEIPANTDFTLRPGDSVLGPSGAGGTFRNDGTEEAVFLVAAVRPVEAATPAP